MKCRDWLLNGAHNNNISIWQCVHWSEWVGLQPHRLHHRWCWRVCSRWPDSTQKILSNLDLEKPHDAENGILQCLGHYDFHLVCVMWWICWETNQTYKKKKSPSHSILLYPKSMELLLHLLWSYRVHRQSGFPMFISCQRQDPNVLPKRQQSHQGDKLCDVSTVPLVARWPIFLACGSDTDGEPHWQEVRVKHFGSGRLQSPLCAITFGQVLLCMHSTSSWQIPKLGGGGLPSLWKTSSECLYLIGMKVLSKN